MLVLPRLHIVHSAVHESTGGHRRAADTDIEELLVDWLPCTLRDLVISDGDLLAPSAADLAPLTSLTRLDMDTAAPRTLAHVVTTLTQLERLRLHEFTDADASSCSGVRRNVLELIAEHLPELRDLALRGSVRPAACGVPNSAAYRSDAQAAFLAGLQALARLPALRQLQLPPGVQLSDSVARMGKGALKGVSRCTALTTLAVHLGDASLISRQAAPLASLSLLLCLSLHMPPTVKATVQLRACSALAALCTLTALSLHSHEEDDLRLPVGWEDEYGMGKGSRCRVRIGCAGVSAFAGSFGSLRRLSICGLFDERIAPFLGKLSSLTELSLVNHEVMRRVLTLPRVLSAAPSTLSKLRLKRVDGRLFTTVVDEDGSPRLPDCEEQLFPHLPVLEELEITHADTLSCVVLQSCPRLQVLSLHECRQLTTIGGDVVARQSLRSTQLTHCGRQLTRQGHSLRVAGFASSELPQCDDPCETYLEHIALTGVRCMSTWGSAWGLLPSPRLCELRLYSCCLFTSSLKHLSTATNLRVCHLEECVPSSRRGSKRGPPRMPIYGSDDQGDRECVAKDLAEAVRDNMKLESLCIVGAGASAVDVCELRRLTRLTHLELLESRS